MISCHRGEIVLRGDGLTLMAELGCIAGALYKNFMEVSGEDESCKRLIHKAVDQGLEVAVEEMNKEELDDPLETIEGLLSSIFDKMKERK